MTSSNKAAGLGTAAGALIGTSRHRPRPSGNAASVLRPSNVAVAAADAEKVAPAQRTAPERLNLEAPRVKLKEIAFNPIGYDELRHGPDADFTDIRPTVATVGIADALIIAEASFFKTVFPEHKEHPFLDGKSWVALDGNRRLRTSLLEGVDEVPVQLNNAYLLDGQDSRIRLITSAARRQLSPIAEAQDYARLRERGDSTQKIADDCACSKGNVIKKLALLELPADLQLAVARGRIAAESGYKLTQVKEPQVQAAAFALLTEDGKSRTVDRAIAIARAAAEKAEIDADGGADVRGQAWLKRDACIVSILKAEVPDDLTEILARNVIRKQDAFPPALALAHRWMRSAEIGPAVDEPTAFAGACRRDARLLTLLSFAVVLAFDELHARKDSRHGWDERATAHHDRLTAAGYETGPWEAEKLVTR
jgi:ParB/RepB/Spo0J family partition protein